MNHYKHLNTEDREKASVLIAQAVSIREIARRLGRSPSTISREIARNSKKNGEYSPSYAETKYRKRKSNNGARHIFAFDSEKKKYVQQKLDLFWSPEQIAGRAKFENLGFHLCVATIYNSIANGTLDKALRAKLRHKRKKNKKVNPNDNRGKILDTVSIHDRPEVINTRSELGHWESDTVLGQRKTGLIVTHVERLTGFLIGCYLPNLKDKSFNIATIDLFSNLPDCLKKSFTVDNGNEFVYHKELSADTNMQIYFCDPCSPWQRGLNENTNGLLRQFFPKKSSFANISNELLQEKINLINNRPRKRLGWKSPSELLLFLISNCCTYF